MWDRGAGQSGHYVYGPSTGFSQCEAYLVGTGQTTIEFLLTDLADPVLLLDNLLVETTPEPATLALLALGGLLLIRRRK